MKKTITSLVVMPLIASAVFLASPDGSLASNHMRTAPSEIRNVTSKEDMPNTKKGIAGRVASINGNIVLVTSKNNTQYTVDTARATIMKESQEKNSNPALVNISDIKVGDIIFVRGVIKDTE